MNEFDRIFVAGQPLVTPQDEAAAALNLAKARVLREIENVKAAISRLDEHMCALSDLWDSDAVFVLLEELGGHDKLLRHHLGRIEALVG